MRFGVKYPPISKYGLTGWSELEDAFGFVSDLDFDHFDLNGISFIKKAKKE